MKTAPFLIAFGALAAFASGCAYESPHATYSSYPGYSPTGISSSPAPVYQSSEPTYPESTTELVQPATQTYIAPAPPPPPRRYAPGPVYYMPNNILTSGKTAEDKAIADEIVRRALAAGAVTAGGPNFKVSVQNRHVHLMGRVERWQHRAVKDIARSTPGVRGLEDDLKF